MSHLLIKDCKPKQIIFATVTFLSSLHLAQTLSPSSEEIRTQNASSRWLRSLDSTYKCGECLSNGYQSCVGYANDHTFTTTYTGTDTTKNLCCQLSDECKSTFTSWTCSTGYNNTLYAKFACPFNTQNCGTNDTYSLSKIGDTMSLSFSLSKGDVCFYKILNTCGRLTVDLKKLDNSDSVLAEYIEFDDSQVMLAGSSDVLHGSKGGAPAQGMPWRTESFVYDSSYSVFQGRLFYGQGTHYWGGYTQGSQSDLPSGTQPCSNRYTYLIFTSLTSTATTGQVALNVVAQSQGFTFRVQQVVFLILSVVLLNLFIL